LPRQNPYFKDRLEDGYFFTTSLVVTALKKAGFSLQTGCSAKLNGLRKKRSEICFAKAERYELKTQSGKKICGIAQRRSKNTILQQGTIKVGWLVNH
jgi:lipoate-protein ligase A